MKFMIFDLRFTISQISRGQDESGVAPFKSSIIHHQS